MVLVPLQAAAGEFDQELAKAHFLTGQDYYEQQRFEDALKEFNEAYRLSRRPAFQFNIAVCQTRLGRLDEAIAAFERYLSESPATPDRDEVERRIAELRARKAAQAPPPAPVVAVSKSPPAGRSAHRRGWVWGVVGAVAAAAVAVGLGVGLGVRGDTVRTLPDVTPK
jgi:tetratricopeptide (TPR) repeat protein